MARKPISRKPSRRDLPSFAELLQKDPDLSGLRADYRRKSVSVRRRAAGWAYDESLARSLFNAVVARLPDGKLPGPGWPPGFAALAIDPDYAPALLTVGCHEYGSGHPSEGMRLLLRLAELPPDTPDWVEIIDKAADYLMEANAPGDTLRLYEAGLKVRPGQQEFIIGMGWSLCRAGKRTEALPWLERAVANAPEDSAALSDYGWALTELGRFDEAEPILEKAVRLAPPGYDLPVNNLEQLRQMRSQRDREPERGTIEESRLAS